MILIDKNSLSTEETERIGTELAALIEKNNLPRFVALYGDLGVGKTAFIRGFSAFAAPGSNVKSPTFTLVNEYKNGKIPVFHFDMYRISTWDDLYSTGYFDYLDAEEILAVEWSENIENALPEDCIKVIFSPGENENERNIEIIGVDLL